ncbi:MAG TPA: copper resistance protein CopC [Gaiellaceae bacterium]|nr:copper resistance protein CopC [Gaiellaceae bacterium]
MRLAVAALAVLALAAPADAFAHATLLQTSPQNGAVLDTSPRRVTATFDDSIRVAGGNAAVANTTNKSVLAGTATAHGSTLVLPLEPNLPDGDYSARWSIVSEDGHREEGVVAFAVGAGSPSPSSVLGAGVALTWNDILLRTLFYLGLLAGGGAAVFGLMSRTLFGTRLLRPLAHLLFFSLLLTFIGGSGILHTAPPGTRFSHVMDVAITIALIGGAAAALAPSVPRLLWLAGASALVLLAAPTLAGHALDRDQPKVVSVVADLAHLASASVWLGGLIALVWVVPRATDDEDERRAAARMFSATALAAVLVLAASGLARALTELSSVSQIWSTSYGRALIVKTALFVPLLGVGWLNRTRLLTVFARLRRSVRIEIVGIVGILVAVAILTELRPGVEASRATAAPLAAPLPPVLPPRDAVVDARELGSLAVAVAREPRRTTVTLLDQDGTGANGRTVLVDDRPTLTCGAGCYRAASPPAGPLRIDVDGTTLTFDIPSHAPDASALLAKVTRAYRSSKTIVFDEKLASSPTDSETTRFTVRAPHTLTYQTKNGPQAVVIGGKRWDRDTPTGRWVESAQTPLDVTEPYWSNPTNVHEIAPGVLTFLDRTIPAWFHVTIANGRPSVQHMTAAAHFMVDRYVGFDRPVTVSPPVSR